MAPKHRLLTIFLFFTALAAAPQESVAAQRPLSQFGLGVILGEPTGITTQYQLSSKRALNSGLAYSFHEWMEIYTDYIFKMPTFYRDLFRQETRLIGTVGVGGLFAFNNKKNADDDIVFGVRLPFGGEYWLEEAPVAFFFELVPGLQLVDETGLILQGGIGARYYF